MVTRLIMVINFIMCTNVKSLCSIPETKITLTINYISVKKFIYVTSPEIFTFSKRV